MRRLAPLDRALVLILVPLWVVRFALDVRTQVRGQGINARHQFVLDATGGRIRELWEAESRGSDRLGGPPATTAQSEGNSMRGGSDEEPDEIAV